VVETDKAGQRKAYMVVDGQRSAGYDGLGKEASFSPDSKRFAYLVGIPAVEGKDLKEALVMDGEVEGRYDSIAASPAWSPNSRHYAYWATQEDKTLVIKDGIALGKYDFATALVFSSDSAHLAWWAKVGAWYRLVVDGQPVGSPYSSYACSFGLKVDANGVRGVAVKEKDVRQISVQWR
jgi:hypothetical protein